MGKSVENERLELRGEDKPIFIPSFIFMSFLFLWGVVSAISAAYQFAKSCDFAYSQTPAGR